jgi:hypothetical protein
LWHGGPTIKWIARGARDILLPVPVRSPGECNNDNLDGLREEHRRDNRDKGRKENASAAVGEISCLQSSVFLLLLRHSVQQAPFSSVVGEHDAARDSTLHLVHDIDVSLVLEQQPGKVCRLIALNLNLAGCEVEGGAPVLPGGRQRGRQV